jgi:predicted RNA-binding protein YlqC (UPF0109 family)
MESSENEILTLVRALAKHPDQLRVCKVYEHPVTFEIVAHQDDLHDLMLRERAIRVMAGASGLVDIKLKFTEISAADWQCEAVS